MLLLWFCLRENLSHELPTVRFLGSTCNPRRSSYDDDNRRRSRKPRPLRPRFWRAPKGSWSARLELAQVVLELLIASVHHGFTHSHAASADHAAWLAHIYSATPRCSPIHSSRVQSLQGSCRSKRA